jgi:hypothetical protein
MAVTRHDGGHCSQIQAVRDNNDSSGMQNNESLETRDRLATRPIHSRLAKRLGSFVAL